MVRGLQPPPTKNALRARNFKIFTFLRDPCAKTLCVSGSEPILFCTPRGLLVSALTHLRAAPYILAPGPPGRPTPKKVFSKFRKNLRGRGQFFECAKRRPPRAVRDKILATVPWPIFAEKNSKISPKIDFFSSYKNFRQAKNIWAMRAHSP